MDTSEDYDYSCPVCNTQLKYGQEECPNCGQKIYYEVIDEEYENKEFVKELFKKERILNINDIFKNLKISIYEVAYIVNILQNDNYIIECNNSFENNKEYNEEADMLLNDAIDLVVGMGEASASMLQRRFKIGYGRAARMIDQMEERGLISGYEGSKPRKVLITNEEWEKFKLVKDIDIYQDYVINGKVEEEHLNIKIIDNCTGLEFENFCKEILIKNDFYNVTVTKSSGDQGADIIAEKDEIKYAIQCKRYYGNVGNSAVQEVIGSRSIYDCHVGLVITNSYFTKSAIELANKNRILLWDREKLKKLLK